jgi:hypothetical protein
MRFDSLVRTNEFPSKYKAGMDVSRLGEEADFVVIYLALERVKSGHVRFLPSNPEGPLNTRVVDTEGNEHTPIAIVHSTFTEVSHGSAEVMILTMPKAAEPAVLKWGYEYAESTGQEPKYFYIDMNVGTTEGPGHS